MSVKPDVVYLNNRLRQDDYPDIKIWAVRNTGDEPAGLNFLITGTGKFEGKSLEFQVSAGKIAELLSKAIAMMPNDFTPYEPDVDTFDC